VSAGRLRYDHRSFVARFDELCVRAGGHGWLPILGSWTGFAADVERHFAFEELSVFPVFMHDRRGDGSVIRTLLDQHEDLRSLLDQLSTAVACERVALQQLEGFTVAMASHEVLETTRIDPWLERQERRHDPRAR